MRLLSMVSRIVRVLKVLSVAVGLVGLCAAANGSPAGQGSDDNGRSRPRIIRLESGTPGSLQTADLGTSNQAAFNPGSLSSGSAREVDGIEQTLERYQSAFENLNLRQVRQVWPSLDRQREEKFKEVFDAFRSTSWTRKLGMECAMPVFTGEAASVACKETLTYGPADGTAKEVGPNRVAISLKKSSSMWVVENMKGMN
jgi:hypothetical protein